MRNTETGRAEVIKSRRNYQKYVLILLFMSAMVAGMVVLGLMQPAVTMTYTCGFNYEHTHSIENDCYELICGMDEGDIEEDGVTPHVHSESCYDMSHTICGFEEHKHTDECFVKEEDKEAEATEATEETEPAEVLAEEMTEETTEAAPEVIEIRNIDLGEIYALDRKSTELSAQEAAKLTHNSPAFDISDYVEDMSYDEDSNIAEDSEKENAVQLTMKFRIPVEAFEDENRTVYCKLPEAVSLGDKQTARLYMSEAFDDTMPYEICRYKLEPKENMLIMQFSQEQIGDGNCSVVCKFKFDAIVKMDDAEAENQTISEGDVTLEVKAPLLKNYTVAGGEDPTEPTTDPAETTAETSGEPEETTTVTTVAAPELVIIKSPAAQSAEDINGGYSESNKMVKFKVEFEVKNGTGGKDVVFKDKLDDLFTYVNNNNMSATKTVGENSPNVYNTLNLQNINSGWDWRKTIKTYNNNCEFIIDKSNFYDSNGTTPLASVKYEIEYYAKLADGNTDSYIAYAASTGQNYAEISLANVDGSGNITNETGNQTSDMNSLAENERSIYRGYTISQTNTPAYDSNRDVSTWSIEVKRGVNGWNNQLSGDMSGFVVYDDTLKHTDKVTISGEEYTSGAAGTKGTFNKDDGTFTFKENTTDNSYTLTYENLPDYNGYVNNGTGAKEGTVSQPILKKSDRTIAQGNAIPIVKVSRKAEKNITVGSQYDWTVDLKGGERAFVVRGDQDSNEVMLTFSTSNNSDVHYLHINDNETNILNAVKITFKDSNGNPVALTRGTKGNASENNDYYISFYDDADAKSIISDESTILNKTAKVKGIRIGLNETNNSKTVSQMEIKYNTDRVLNSLTDDSPIGSKAEFTTNVGWRGFVSKSVTETKQHQYIIFDYTNKDISVIGDSVTYVEKTDASYKTGDVTDGDNMILSWGIEGNYAATYNDTGDVTYNVTLPTGASLVPSGDKAPRLYKRNGNNFDDGTVIESTEMLHIDGQTVQFTVPAEARTNGAKFRIGFSVRIPKATAMSNADPATGKDFTVTVTDGKNQLTQTQNVVPTVITKSSKQQEEWHTDQVPNQYSPSQIEDKTYNAKSHYVDYTLDVNPDAIELNGGKQITVYDHLIYDKYSDTRAILVGFEVWSYENGVMNKLDDSKYSYSSNNASIESDLADTLDEPGLDVYVKGSWFYLKLNDKKHYQIKYTYHFLGCATFVTDIYTPFDFNATVENTAQILNTAGAVVGESEKINLRNQGYKLYKYDSDDDYAVIEAVSDQNYNIKIPGCYFAFLKYDPSTKKWSVMTSATTDDTTGKITPTAWQDYTEITRGDTPELVKQKNNCYLLGPTDEKGRTRLPEMDTEKIFYRVVEVQPADGYAVNPDKLYLAYLNSVETSTQNTPSNVYFDRLTGIYKNDLYNGNMVGTVIVDNTGRGYRDINLVKEWADSLTSHQDVTFNSFRSYKTNSRSNTNHVTFELYDCNNNQIGATTDFDVPTGNSFEITLRNGNIKIYSAFIFNVNGVNVTNYTSSNPWTQQADYVYDSTVKARVDDNENVVYYSWPLVVDTNVRTGNVPPGITYNSDASIWSANVTTDLVIKLTITQTGEDALSPSTEIIAPTFTKGDYDTIDNLPDEADRLEINDFQVDEVSPITIGENAIGENAPWTYTWHHLPSMDCYGYRYYYYVEEAPYGTTNGKSNAETNLHTLYGKDYEIRYYNNGAINGNEILVRNHESDYIKSLPATGSSGKDFYMGIGLSIVGCAAITLFLRKRSRGVVQRP